VSDNASASTSVGRLRHFSHVVQHAQLTTSAPPCESSPSSPLRAARVSSAIVSRCIVANVVGSHARSCASDTGGGTSPCLDALVSGSSSNVVAVAANRVAPH
jgi:hypothetical protein